MLYTKMETTKPVRSVFLSAIRVKVHIATSIRIELEKFEFHPLNVANTRNSCLSYSQNVVQYCWKINYFPVFNQCCKLHYQQQQQHFMSDIFWISFARKKFNTALQGSSKLDLPKVIRRQIFFCKKEYIFGNEVN